MTLAVGTRLGGYEIIGSLVSGGLRRGPGLDERFEHGVGAIAAGPSTRVMEQVCR